MTSAKHMLIGCALTFFSVTVVVAQEGLDPAFGCKGVTKFDVQGNGSDDVGRAVVVDRDGNIFVGGHSGRQFCLVRFTRQGKVDKQNFGGGKGYVIPPEIGGELSWIHALAIQEVELKGVVEEKLVAVGRRDKGGHPDMVIARFNKDGQLDKTFAGKGIKVVDLKSAEIARGVAIQEVQRGAKKEERIVVAGSYGRTKGAEDPNWDLLVLRLNVDGSFDETFNPTGTGSHKKGVVITDFTFNKKDHNYAVGVAVGGDKIIVAANCSEKENALLESAEFERVVNHSRAFSLAKYKFDGKLVPQITIVSPPTPKFAHLLDSLPSFPSMSQGV